MKVIAAMQVDLDTTPLGTKSRLGTEIGGEPVLRRTIGRLQSTTRARDIFVLCPTPQEERCQRLIDGTGAMLMPFSGAAPPWRQLVASARKWSLDGWRGGIGGALSFDEFVDCRLLAGLLDSAPADAVLCVPPDAPLLSPELADGMIELLEATADDSRMIFSQAPPGLAGLLMQDDLVRELAGQNMPVGWVFSYKPDTPQKDLIFLPCCYEVPPELRYASGRLVADTDRSMRRIADLITAHPNADVRTIGTWLQQRDAAFVEPRPREVEIELTTDDPFPNTLLRPRGDRVPRRGPIAIDVVERITRELCHDDDALILLGGFGDPLRHPQLAEVLACIHRTAAEAGAGTSLGLCVRTAGVDLTDATIDLLIEHGVDVLQVSLDAWSPELFGRLHAPDDPERADLGGVCAKLDRLAARREALRSVRPILVPDFIKAKDNLDEMDAFHDGWIRRHGAVSITGFCHHAMQCEDRSVMRMAPPLRTACRRMNTRCVVLADGSVTMCDQDFTGRHAIGRIGAATLEQLWAGPGMEALRDDHRRGAFDAVPLCRQCDEWHRP